MFCNFQRSIFMHHISNFPSEEENENTDSQRNNRQKQEEVGQAALLSEEEVNSFAGSTEDGSQFCGNEIGDRAGKEPNAHQERSIFLRSQFGNHRQPDW